MGRYYTNWQQLALDLCSHVSTNFPTIYKKCIYRARCQYCYKNMFCNIKTGGFCCGLFLLLLICSVLGFVCLFCSHLFYFTYKAFFLRVLMVIICLYSYFIIALLRNAICFG